MDDDGVKRDSAVLTRMTHALLLSAHTFQQQMVQQSPYLIHIIATQSLTATRMAFSRVSQALQYPRTSWIEAGVVKLRRLERGMIAEREDLNLLI